MISFQNFLFVKFSIIVCLSKPELQVLLTNSTKKSRLKIHFDTKIKSLLRCPCLPRHIYSSTWRVSYQPQLNAKFNTHNAVTNGKYDVVRGMYLHLLLCIQWMKNN